MESLKAQLSSHLAITRNPSVPQCWITCWGKCRIEGIAGNLQAIIYWFRCRTQTKDKNFRWNLNQIEALFHPLAWMPLQMGNWGRRWVRRRQKRLVEVKEQMSNNQENIDSKYRCLALFYFITKSKNSRSHNHSFLFHPHYCPAFLPFTTTIIPIIEVNNFQLNILLILLALVTITLHNLAFGPDNLIDLGLESHLILSHSLRRLLSNHKWGESVDEVLFGWVDECVVYGSHLQVFGVDDLGDVEVASEEFPLGDRCVDGIIFLQLTHLLLILRLNIELLNSLRTTTTTVHLAYFS